MAARYTVFRGPGNRLVAISTSPQHGQWIIRSGEEGKRLRHAVSPLSRHPDFASVKSDFVDDGYEALFTGAIDSYGRSTDSSAALVYWEASKVDAQGVAARLREFSRGFGDSLGGLSFTDDMTGVTVRSSRCVFGVTRAVTAGCIDFDGNGADALSTESSADLLCLVAVLASEFHLRLADGSGNSLSSGQVLSRCAARVSAEMSEYLKSLGDVSLSLSIRTLASRRTQIRF